MASQAAEPQWVTRIKAAYKHPRRKIVGEWYTTDGLLIEQLECGHEQPLQGSAYPDRPAASRFCRRCPPMSAEPA